MTDVEVRILAALKTYQWEQTAVIYNFAAHLDYTESHVRRYLNLLAAEGKVERIESGQHKGKPTYIYKLRTND